MKKNIRVNISISPGVLEDAKRVADARFAGNVSAYISALIDADVRQRGISESIENESGIVIKESSVGKKAVIKSKSKK